MGEANRWQDAFREALQTQAVLMVGLSNRIHRLEKQIDELTKTDTSGPEAIHGVTGAKYYPQAFAGPSGVPRKEDIDKQGVHSGAEGGDILA